MATRRGPSRWRKRINSHEAFVHDSIDSLGYDWGRIADPAVKPQFPFKVYLPRTTADVVRVVKEAKALGEPLTIRCKGHSSNGLVLNEGGSVLLTEKLNAVLSVDEAAMTATVQAGAVSAEVDDELAELGLGLPVIGDHAHVTVGGFVSVGGISASSFRYGLFVDIVERLEWVDWDGELHTCSRTEDADDFYRLVLGLGRHGVIATITVRVIRVAKYDTLWENDLKLYREFDQFLSKAYVHLYQPPDEARFMRGMWVDFGMGGLGQFSIYTDTAQTTAARRRNDIAYGFLHSIGYVSGRLPGALDRALKYVGLAGIVLSPRYATVKNAETFSDKILDATVGEPTRYLVAIAPMRSFDAVCRRLSALLKDYRRRTGCFTVITLYVKGIHSEYLTRKRPDDRRWAEILFYVAIDRKKMTDELLDRIADDMDDICIEEGAYRYMHSRTSKDPERMRRIDPNAAYFAALEPSHR
ncbi:MAG TPA: FAD-binding oxidoreductase [Acidimicrobiales bacterium]|nr:FAD-binding oxidoreductase [Acidimicrobiales bacterium]